jgi:hypothetical protein
MGSETNCYDGIDNDCDGLVDCADPNCLRKHCTSGSGSTSVCCSTAPNATACKNLAADGSNCGACGNVCSQGACQPVSEGGHDTGACPCTSNNQCQDHGEDPKCIGNKCTCDNHDSACGGGATCEMDYCYYP